MKIFKITHANQKDFKGEGVVFYDKKIVVCWKGLTENIVLYDNYDDLLKLGHIIEFYPFESS